MRLRASRGASSGHPRAWPTPPLPALDLDFVAAGALDPRVTFSRASGGTYFDADGILRTAAVDAPRFDFDPATRQPRGLLIEGQRTNAIRNSTAQGAAAGTPGTMPTNWFAFTASAGISREVVGTGFEDGIQYIDIRASGTTTGTLFWGIRPEIVTQIAAANEQTWTSTFYVRLIGGSLENITRLNHAIQFSNAAGAGLTFGVGGIVPTSAPLNTQRFSRTATASDAATAFVVNLLQIEANAGASIDVTLRIGLPQLEQGAFATSAIPTTNAAATRAADVAAMTGANVSAWLNAAEGTLVAEAQAPAGGAALAVLDSGAMSDRIQLAAAANYTPSFAVVSGGAVQADLYASPAAAGSVMRVAGAYRVNDFALVGNGGGQLVDTSAAVPAGLANLRLGAFSIGTEPLNGHLRRVRYWRERLPVHTLRGLTR